MTSYEPKSVGGPPPGSDSREVTEPARRAFWSKFERDVDPDGILPIDERMRRADMARKAHFARHALKSAQARRKKAAHRVAAYQARQIGRE